MGSTCLSWWVNSPKFVWAGKPRVNFNFNLLRLLFDNIITKNSYRLINWIKFFFSSLIWRNKKWKITIMFFWVDLTIFFIFLFFIFTFFIYLCSDSVNNYVQAVKELACEILDLVAEGLWVRDKCAFSRLIRDVDSDSVLRLNHYPPVNDINDWDPSSKHYQCKNNRIGFGEHSDPQILTILRSNDVGGLQISLKDGLWVPVPPDPREFCVFVGDALQVGNNRINSLIIFNF